MSADRPQHAARTSILVVGVGGQGVVTAAEILGHAAIDAGIDATLGQVHGMAQRGGSVENTVLLGPHQSAHLGVRGADIVLAFEPIEALRALPRMSRHTTVIASRTPIVPFGLTFCGREYPDLATIDSQIRANVSRLIFMDAARLALEAGDERAINIVMLGALAALRVLPFAESHLISALARTTPPNRVEVDRRAFLLGQTSPRETSTG